MANNIKSYKIAMLAPTRVDGILSGSHLLRDIAVLLNSYKSIKLTIFSIHEKDNYIKKLNYTENVSKSQGFIGNKNILIRFIDYLTLLINGREYTYFIRNANKELRIKINKFNPNVIITSYEFADFVYKYKKAHEGVAVIALMDDPKQIKENVTAKINGINSANKLKNKFYLLFAKIIGTRHIEFLEQKYGKLVKIADNVINFTDEGKSASIKRYKKYKNKFYVIPPPIFLNKNKISISNTRHKVKNILFIGSSGYAPNDEAVNIIEKYIAPELKEINFNIVGQGYAVAERGNIHYLGTVKNLNPVLAKADLCIAPIMHGGGIKTKIITYLISQRPIIGTSIAFEGYQIKDGHNAIICNNAEEYPKIIKELSKNYKLRRKLSKNELEVVSNFSATRVKKLWLKLILDVLKARVTPEK